jgi:hypothetical protein
MKKIAAADLDLLRQLYLGLPAGSVVNLGAPSSFSWMGTEWPEERRAEVVALAGRLIRQRIAGNARTWEFPGSTRKMLKTLFSTPAFAAYTSDARGNVQAYVRTTL